MRFASLVFSLYLLGVSASELELRSEYDLCNPRTVHKDPQRIHFSKVGLSVEIFVNLSGSGTEYDSHLDIHCLMSLWSCPECRFEVTPLNNFDYNSCWNMISKQYRNEKTCPENCGYVQLFDINYPHETIHTVTSHNGLQWKSTSPKMQFRFCSNFDYAKSMYMRFRVTTVESTQYLKDASQNPGKHILQFSSPYFPKEYSLESSMFNYSIRSGSSHKYLVLTFDDWIVSPQSRIQVDSSDGHFVFPGSSNRPFVRSFKSMNVTFITCCFRNSTAQFFGFRARVTFYEHPEISRVNTDCGFVEQQTIGGIITFKNTQTRGQYVDCIWVLKKFSDFSYLYLKVINLKEDIDLGDNNLEIRTGLTSMETYVPSNMLTVELTANEGFYIRLKGLFYSEDVFTVVYASYKMYDCSRFNYIYRVFECHNGRCIYGKLICDGYNHCGDHSDEETYECLDKVTSITPKTKEKSRGSELGINIIIPLVVSILLVIVVCILIVFIWRCRKRFDHRPQGHSSRSRQPRNNRRRQRGHRNPHLSVTNSSGDFPPTYQEVIESSHGGLLNIGFNWCQAEPPSYEEATTPLTPDPVDSISRQTLLHQPSSTVFHTDATTTSNMSRPLSLPASLNPDAEVSSSSSSEDAGEPRESLDISSSSDASTDNEHSFQILDQPHTDNENTNKDNNSLNSEQICVDSPLNNKRKSTSSIALPIDESASLGSDSFVRNHEIDRPTPEVDSFPGEIEFPVVSLNHVCGRNNLNRSRKAQSCADLLGGGHRKLERLSKPELSDNHKRYSYAGAGDASCNVDQRLQNQEILRNKSVEYLNKGFPSKTQHQQNSEEYRTTNFGLNRSIDSVQSFENVNSNYCETEEPNYKPKDRNRERHLKLHARSREDLRSPEGATVGETPNQNTNQSKLSKGRLKTSEIQARMKLLAEKDQRQPRQKPVRKKTPGEFRQESHSSSSFPSRVYQPTNTGESSNVSFLDGNEEENDGVARNMSTPITMPVDMPVSMDGDRSFSSSFSNVNEANDTLNTVRFDYLDDDVYV